MSSATIKEAASGSVDAILLKLGRKGRFQILQGIMQNISNVSVCFHLFSIVFTAQLMEYRCDESILWNNETFPDSSVLTNDTCSAPASDSSNMTSSKECTDWIYARDKTLSLTSEWNLVCGRAYLARLPQSLFIAGQAVGAVLFSTLSDKYGRRPALLSAHVMTAAAGIALAFSPNIVVFCILRFINGIFQQGIVVSTSTFLMETFLASQRVTISAINHISWSGCTILMTLVAYLLRHSTWRTTQLVFTSFSVTVLLHIVFISESLRWLITNRKNKQAMKVFDKAAKLNNLDATKLDLTRAPNQELTEEKSPPSIDVVYESSDQTYQYSCLDIFRSRFMLKVTLVVWFSWWVDSLTYFSLYLTSSSLAPDLYLNFFLNSLAEVPSGFLYLYIARRFGRRKFFLSMHAVAGVCLLLATGVRAASDNNTAASITATCLAFLGKICNTACFGNMFTYTPEIYPTNIRTIGMGSGSTASRFGGAIAPFVQMLADAVPWAPGTIFGVACLITAALNTMFPESEGQELPQSIADIIKWEKNKLPDSKHT